MNHFPNVSGARVSRRFSTSWNDSWWISYTLLVDIGTQTGLPATERGSIKLVSAVISLVGFVYFLTLLGMVVDLLRDFLNETRPQLQQCDICFPDQSLIWNFPRFTSTGYIPMDRSPD
eukprot:Skav228183  [mRNA]  locus=scaffold3933:302760:305910:+ [translate_table: standard]